MNRHNFEANWPAPNNYLIELGRITALWGTLEATVNVTINNLAGYTSPLDYRAFILIAHANFQQRIHMIGALCEELKPKYPILNSYKEIITKLETAQKARNKYSHNGIVIDEETGKVIMSSGSARGVLKTSTEELRLNDLKEVSAKIHEASCALYLLNTGRVLRPFWERENENKS